MLEGLKAALEHVEGLARENEKTEVIEICGHTYANKSLKRYDNTDKATALEASSLTALLDYIGACYEEFPKDTDMIIHIVNPKRVRLITALDAERTRECLFEVNAEVYIGACYEEFPKDTDMIIHIVNPKRVRLITALDAERTRECLFEVNAEVNEFRFGHWYDQEAFMIELQANFQSSEDLELVQKMAGNVERKNDHQKMAGNVERKNDQSYADDGISQVAVMTVGAAAKADVKVPNPVTLVPYRTFQEVGQPASAFVFRVGDKGEPTFMLQEAQNGLWRNEAVANIKAYLAQAVSHMQPNVRDHITIIG